MQVAYLADALYHGVNGGLARYTAELARHLSILPDIDLRPFSTYPPEVMQARARERGYFVAEYIPQHIQRKLPQYLSWHLAGVAPAVARATAGADLLHTPVPLVPPRGCCPLVVTVPDLSSHRVSRHHRAAAVLLTNSGLWRARRDADAFITFSEHAARDFIQHYGVARERVYPIPLAAAERFRPQADASVPARYGIDGPYILFVGTLEPRKNLPLLLRSFADLPDVGVRLVLAGGQGWMNKELMSTLEQLKLKSRVIFTGFVEDQDLPALMTEARVFVYPSVFEGFGLPVLEAMQCGVPVITTNVTSLPEVAGDAAILVPPDDTGALTAALRRVLAEPGLREEMRGRGLMRAKQFSWRRTAEMTAQVYQTVLQQGVRPVEPVFVS